MSIYDSLNEQQKKGVLTVDGPVLLLAGAGSGKTRVLTHRIAYLIEERDVNPYNILAITFTNKAAKEMRDRVDNLVSMDAGGAWVMTFHAACMRILRRYINLLGYDTNFTIYDTDDQKSVVKEVVKRLNLDPKLYKEKSVLSQISKAKDELITPDELELLGVRDFQKRNIANIYREYQMQLHKSNALDFDDIIFKTVELFEKHPDVLEYYQDRFKYIMVDEYQDTNTSQFKFINLLASRHRNLCVVGDDDQSIYKFRGANIKNILNFEHFYPEAAVIKLEQNYRSTGNILDVANKVIRNNEERKDKQLWTSEDAGDKVRYRVYNTGFEEASGIATDIAKQVNDGYSYKDIAILYRTNAQSRTLEEKLLNLNIPYKIYGGINFYGRKEIKDILAYLKTIDNARDDLAVRRIINIPKRGIGDTTVSKLSLYAQEHGISLYKAMANVSDITTINKKTADKISEFCLTISAFRAKAENLAVKELIKTIIEDIRYEEYLSEDDEKEEVEDRLDNISELISKAAIYEENTEMPTLSGFLEEVALVADIDSMDDNDDIVSLMTLHSAKGLEFPIVYMAGMEDGLFPSYMAVTSDDKSDIEEERRLCYVGITRARKLLTLSMAKQRMVRGETQFNKTSRFIKEIPVELLEDASSLARNSYDNNLHDRDSFEGISSDRRIYTKDDEAMLDSLLPWNMPSKSATNKTMPSKATVSSYITKGAPSIAKNESELGYVTGDRVKHIKFGIGTVTNIASGGRDFEVTVDFDSYGTKKMFASFAKLVKID